MLNILISLLVGMVMGVGGFIFLLRKGSTIVIYMLLGVTVFVFLILATLINIGTG